jgi:hypothetical protein
VDCCAGLLCLVGTYEPAVELLLLQTQHSRGKGTCGQFQRLCRLQKETICPVLHSSGLPASAGLTDVPESVLLLKGATPHTQVQVLFGGFFPPLHHIQFTVKSSCSVLQNRVMRAPVTAGAGWVAEWAALTDQSHAAGRD